MKKLLFIIICLFALVGCQSEEPEKTPEEKENTPSESTNKKETSKEKETETPKKEEKEPIHEYTINTNNFRIESETDDRKLVLLTIDDVPRNIDIGRNMLNTLEEKNVKAIWFINGMYIQRADGTMNEEAVSFLKEIHEKGHMIGNHSFSHPDLTTLSSSKLNEEIKKNSDLIEEIIGEKPTFLRPPFGQYNDNVISVAKQHGMLTTNWSVGALDWEYTESEKVKNQIISTMHPGAIILSHDLPQTEKALQSTIEEIRKMNYHFVLPYEKQS
jgi:peptidoglycan-N-acetylglucosamine deacetylase